MKVNYIKIAHIKSWIILLLSLCITTEIEAAQTQKQDDDTRNKSTFTQPPARASPADSCQYSNRTDRKSNIVIINGKVMV